MANREVLHELVDSPPEEDIASAERFLTATPQEPIGPEFARSIRRGIGQAEAGDIVECRDFPEMVEKLLN